MTISSPPMCLYVHCIHACEFEQCSSKKCIELYTFEGDISMSNLRLRAERENMAVPFRSFSGSGRTFFTRTPEFSIYVTHFRTISKRTNLFSFIWKLKYWSYSVNNAFYTSSLSLNNEDDLYTLKRKLHGIFVTKSDSILLILYYM